MGTEGTRMCLFTLMPMKITREIIVERGLKGWIGAYLAEMRMHIQVDWSDCRKHENKTKR